MKSWPDSSGILISNFQIKDKDIRPVLCINKVKPEINVEGMRNSFVRNLQFKPENFKRLVRKNGRETTLITFQLNSDEQIRQTKHYDVTFEGGRCFKCNKFGHFANSCKQIERFPRCNNPNTKCKDFCNKEWWKRINCGGTHSAAWAGCPAYKEKLKEVNTKIQIKTYSQVAASNINNINNKLIKE